MRGRLRLPLSALVAVSAGVALVASGCSGDAAADKASSTGGGELTVLSLGPVVTWDPQRMSSPQDFAFAGRVFTRTLTAFPRAGGTLGDVEGDLATGTGTVDATLTTWTFTLRDDARWQDGSPVTCADVRHGVSRSFAAPFSTQGLNYPLAYLDIPRTVKGASVYAGPWARDKVGQAAFDKAVSCDGAKVTFHLSTPTADFDQIVSLPVFAPVKAAHDKGSNDPYAVFSSGPYQLKGAWDPSTGGTFTRNPHWAKGSDPIRDARPDEIRYLQGTESQTAVQQVINDDSAHRRSVTLDSAPPAMQQQVLADDALRARSVNPTAQFVDYLAPNFRAGVMTNPRVRHAFALSTNREGYVTALGGASAAAAAYSLIGPAIPGHRDTDPLGVGPSGDAARARAELSAAGVTLPVKVRVTYRSTPTADKAMAALVNGWQDAGFDVQLQPVAKDYFTTASAPGQVARTDVFWANWAPSWPSASTVLQPLFDSRINLTAAGNGRDFGGFSDPAVNAEMSRIGRLADPAAAAEAWAALDASLATRGAFIALAQRRSLFLAGSGVTGLSANESLGGFVDLATIGVE